MLHVTYKDLELSKGLPFLETHDSVEKFNQLFFTDQNYNLNFSTNLRYGDKLKSA